MGNSNSSGLKSEEEKIRVKQEECDDGTPDDATSDLQQVSINLEMIYEFYSLGFVKVEEDGDDGETGSSRIIHWPVLQVDPFDAPEKIYKKWLKECQNSTAECKLHLLYQYGVDEFIMKESSLIVSYEEGVKQGFDLIPDHIFTKLKRGKPLLTIEVCLIQSLQKLQIEARKEKLDRKNLWEASKKHGTWVAKRKSAEDDELRSNKRRNILQICNRNDNKVEAEPSKKKSSKFDYREFNEEEKKDGVAQVNEHSQTFNHKAKKALAESSSAEESFSDEDLPELIKISKTQQRSHQNQVETKNESGDSKIHIHIDERDESTPLKTDSTRRNKSDMKEHTSAHSHENRPSDTCIMRPTQQLNPQSFPQQEQKQVPIIEHNAEETIPKQFRNVNIFEVVNERTISFKHWCLSRMSKSIKAKFHEVMFVRYDGNLYPISVLSPFDLFPCDYQSAYLREYLLDDGYALIYYYGSARNLGISPESDLVEFKDGISEFTQALNEIKECKKNGVSYSKGDLKIMTLGFEKAKEDIKRPKGERLKEFLKYEQAKFKFLKEVDIDIVNDYRKIGTIQHRGKQVPVLQVCPLEIGGSVEEQFMDQIMHKKHKVQRRCVFIYGDRTKNVYKFVDAGHIKPIEDGQSPPDVDKRGLTTEERESHARWKHMKLDMQVYRFQRPASLVLPEDL